MGGLKPADVYLLDGLLDALSWGDEDQLFWIVAALHRLGRAASKATPNLIALLDHWSQPVRQLAMSALADVGEGPDVVAACLRRLALETQPSAKAEVARTLATVGRGSTEAVTALLNLVSDRQEQEVVRWAAAISLKLLAPHSEETRIALRALIPDPSIERSARSDLQIAIDQKTELQWREPRIR